MEQIREGREYKNAPKVTKNTFLNPFIFLFLGNLHNDPPTYPARDPQFPNGKLFFLMGTNYWGKIREHKSYFYMFPRLTPPFFIKPRGVIGVFNIRHLGAGLNYIKRRGKPKKNKKCYWTPVWRDPNFLEKKKQTKIQNIGKKFFFFLPFIRKKFSFLHFFKRKNTTFFFFLKNLGKKKQKKKDFV